MMAGVEVVFELRNVLNDEPGMSPLEIWCNESQERYVLAVSPEKCHYLMRYANEKKSPLRCHWRGNTRA